MSGTALTYVSFSLNYLCILYVLGCRMHSFHSLLVGPLVHLTP